MDPVYIEIAQAVARWLIGLIVTVLVTRHVITEDQSQALTSDLMHKVILYSPTLLPLAWAIWRVLKARVKLLTALSPYITNETELNAVIKAGAGVSAFKQGVKDESVHTP